MKERSSNIKRIDNTEVAKIQTEPVREETITTTKGRKLCVVVWTRTKRRMEGNGRHRFYIRKDRASTFSLTWGGCISKGVREISLWGGSMRSGINGGQCPFLLIL